METKSSRFPSLPPQVLDYQSYSYRFAALRFAKDEGLGVCPCSCRQGTSNLGPGTRRIPMYSSFRGVASAGVLFSCTCTGLHGE